MTIGNHTLPTEIMSSCSDGFMWCFAKWANDVTTGMFWTFMLAGFAIALAIATARLGGTRAYAYGSFVGMMGAIWFAIMQLMPWEMATVFIINGVVGAAMLILSSD